MSQNIANLVTSAFQYAVKYKIGLTVRSSGPHQIFSSSDGSTGQRSSYLRYFGSGEANGSEDWWPHTFKLIRKNTFTNKGDEGKDGAVIGVFTLNSLHEVKDIRINTETHFISFGGFDFSFDISPFSF